jgi:hypothetical protein
MEGVPSHQRPGGQGRQCVPLLVCMGEAGEHRVQDAGEGAPGELDTAKGDTARQGWQKSMEEACAAGLNLPAGQGLQEAAPTVSE